MVRGFVVPTHYSLLTTHYSLLTSYYALLTAHCWRNYLYLLQVVKGFAVPVNLQNSLLYVGGSLFAVSSFIMLPEELPKGFLEGYTPLAALLVLFQASETYPPTHSPPPYSYSLTSSRPSTASRSRSCTSTPTPS